MMPIAFNEPLSFLQRITEYMEHVYLVHKASCQPQPLERMQVGGGLLSGGGPGWVQPGWVQTVAFNERDAIGLAVWQQGPGHLSSGTPGRRASAARMDVGVLSCPKAEAFVPGTFCAGVVSAAWWSGLQGCSGWRRRPSAPLGPFQHHHPT